MQGKVQPDPNAILTVYVGIDVCKVRLDVHIHPVGEPFSVTNDAGGWRQLKRKLAKLSVARVVMEATSKYHRAAHRSLAEAGYAVAVVNPLRARLYAEVIGTLAKTDAVDAKVLALMAAQLAPDTTPPASKTLEELGEMAHARRKMVEQRTALLLQHDSTASRMVRDILTKAIKDCDKRIAALGKAITQAIQSDEALSRRYAILTSIPAIGPVIASILIVAMAELGDLSDKQAASLAGLAPFADDSGPRNGNRHIRGGRPDIRRALYQAALVASRHHPQLKHAYARMLDAGKAKKVALIALARKIILLANTLIKENRTWEPRNA